MRSKLSDQSVSLRTLNTGSPVGKHGPRSPQKTSSHICSLTLEKVIGTTTGSPCGFSYHAPSKSFAICAGSAVVLTRLHENGETSQTFFKARPNASAANPVTSVYHATPTVETPTRRRRLSPTLRLFGTDTAPAESPRLEREYNGAQQTWSARERIKSASSISISPDGCYLAIGETGYNPRVLIFPVTEGAPHDRPLSIINEHSFGVRAVAFSPDSRYLATLGDVNDGFLFIWIVIPKSGVVILHSTNKCTANVKDMAWCGSNLVTIGTRHVKVWRVSDDTVISSAKPGASRNIYDSQASPASKTLVGRNCLLGPLVDSTFSCIAPISQHEAVICTDRGKICLYSDMEQTQDLRFVEDAESSIFCVTAAPRRDKVWFGGGDGEVRCDSIERLRILHTPRRQTSTISQSLSRPLARSAYDSPSGSPFRRPTQYGGFVALGYISERVVGVNSESNVKLLDPDTANCLKTFASHTGAVQGLATLAENSNLGAFFSWSGNGDVRFWDLKGTLRLCRNVEVEQVLTDTDDYENELRIMRISADESCIVSGDRLGVMRVIKASDWTTLHEARAHSAEITDIALYGGTNLLIAMCSRDRMVQLFQKNAEYLELLQTMDDHIGSVGHVLFMQEGQTLLSSSSDRTVIVRAQIKREIGGVATLAYVSSRVITLKAAPLQLSLVPGNAEEFAVSTMDRQMMRFDVSSGSPLDTFKVCNTDNDDTVTLSSFKMFEQTRSGYSRLLAGFSSIDKSIRVYDLDRKILLSRESGHTEGVSDVIVVEGYPNSIDKKHLIVSAGLDGIIMIWDLAKSIPDPLSIPAQDLSQAKMGRTYVSEGTSMKGSATLQAPWRKVLSTSEIYNSTGSDISNGSPTPVKTRSPPRIRKKSSRIITTPNKPPYRDALLLPSPRRTPTGSAGLSKLKTATAASPPAALQKQETDHHHLSSARSPCLSAPGSSHGSRTPQPLSSSRLRRPPSIPSHLRSGISGSVRRKSVGNVSNELGNLGTITLQLCHTLRAYRKRLATLPIPNSIYLDEMEVELIATIRCVAERADAKSRRLKAVTDSDLESLASLVRNSALEVGADKEMHHSLHNRDGNISEAKERPFPGTEKQFPTP